MFWNTFGVTDLDGGIADVTTKFTALSKGLTFTFETPPGKLIQFLELVLRPSVRSIPEQIRAFFIW